MLFQSFVGTFGGKNIYKSCKPTSMSFVPTKYLKYQQNIQRNSSFRMQKCEKILSSLAPFARIYIDFLNVSVLSVYCCLFHILKLLFPSIFCWYLHNIHIYYINNMYIHHTISNNQLHWLYVLWRCTLRPENVFLRLKYQKYQQNIEGNSSFRMWKWENFPSSLARSHNLHFLNVSVLSDTVVYSAIP